MDVSAKKKKSALIVRYTQMHHIIARIIYALKKTYLQIEKDYLHLEKTIHG